MDFNDAPEDAAFRAEVRAWLDDHAERKAAEDLEDASFTALWESDHDDAVMERSRAWQRTLAEGGWAAITWPREHGGRDATAIQSFIFAEELAHYDVPPSVSAIGIGTVGPTIIAHGTAEQKARHLPAMLDGSEIWCQLWSEPDAGSDLAAVATKAERDAATGEWVLTGQKVWTSGAHYCDWGLLIARTDPDVPKHRGITCFIVDMRSPGIEVRPLRQMTGGAHFSEVHFDAVRVPADRVVGAVGDGWRVAQTTLVNERSAGVTNTAEAPPVAAVLRLAASTSRHGRPASVDPVVRQRLADLYIRGRLLTLTGFRSLSASASGPEASIMRLAWSGLFSDVATTAGDILGPQSLLVGRDAPDNGRWSLGVLAAPGVHIAGGTDEVQRTIIAERVLGLPREPAVDRDVPFRELRRRATASGS